MSAVIVPTLVLAGTAAVLPFLAERRKPDMNDAARRRAPGQFARLADGATHYRWDGPEDGPVVVCIHGLTTPSHVFDALVPGLVAAGHRVLRYDLYGRGFSDRPRGAQTRHFFIRQLRDLLQDQGITGDLTLIGYSMGGSIATVFTFEEPERVKRLILLAPAGLHYRAGGFAEVARRVPGVGDWLMLAFGGPMLRQGAANQPGHSSIRARMADLQAAEAARRGYLPAVLSAQRNLLSETLDEEHRALAAEKISVTAIWGEADTVIPIRALGRLTQMNRNAEQVVIKGAGHGLVYTHAPEVSEAVLAAIGAPKR